MEDKFIILLNLLTLRKKCPYSELFWSEFSCIRTEYGEILRISQFEAQIGEYAFTLLALSNFNAKSIYVAFCESTQQIKL